MERLAALLLTYLLHSTLLLGLAALLCLAWGERRLALQEALLRVALLGGFVTAGAQVGLGLTPWGGVLRLSARPPEARVVAAQVLERAQTRHAALRTQPAANVARATTWPEPTRLLVWAWGGLSLIGLVRLAGSVVALRRLLRGRRALLGTGLVARAAALARALGLRRSVPLCAAPALRVPLATGLWRGEVCLPERALHELCEDDQSALCAHELAHLARRDPAWIGLLRLATVLAPVQPLNHWARRRLHDLAECLSDDLAVVASARPAGLARSLVDVASWTLSDNPLAPVGAVGAISTRSRLAHRVERLMDTARPLEQSRHAVVPLLACVVFATALVTPVVSGDESGRAPRPPRAPSAPPAPAARPAPVPRVPPVPPVAPLAPVAPSALAAPDFDEAPEAIEAEAPEADEAPEPVEVEAPEAEPSPAHEDALEREMEAIQKRIDARLQAHQADLQAVEEAAARVSAQIEPHEAELERLGEEVARAAHELAARSLKDEATPAARAAHDQARQQLEQAQARMRTLTAEVRIPTDEIRKLGEQARALAEAARPSDEELQALRRLAQEMSRQARVSAADARRMAREAAAAARLDMRRARRAPAAPASPAPQK